VNNRKHIPRPIAASTIIVAGCIWGASFAAMQHALRGGLSVGALLSLRFLTAAVALAVLACFMRLPWNRRAVLEGFWLGLILTAIFWLQVDGLRFTTTGKSAFITGLYVMFTPLVATFWGEHVRWQHAAGAAIATVGLYALVHIPGQPWGGWNRGDFETLLCSVLCGVQIVLTTRYNQRSNTWILLTVQVAAVGILSALMTAALPGVYGFEGTVTALRKPDVLASIAYLVALATFFCFWAMNTMQAHLTSTEAAVMFTSEPVAAAVISIFWLHEAMRPTQLLGGAVIVLAMLFSEIVPAVQRRTAVSEATD
jgi:drug/metabolite transporter (DMT)-like permease